MDQEAEKQKIGIKQNCCRDCYNAYKRLWAKLHREKHRHYTTAWSYANKESIATYRRASYQRNRTTNLERSKRWHREHHVEVAEKKRLRSKQEQDALLARDPVIAIMMPHFVRRTGKPRRKAERANIA